MSSNNKDESSSQIQCNMAISKMTVITKQASEPSVP